MRIEIGDAVLTRVIERLSEPCRGCESVPGALEDARTEAVTATCMYLSDRLLGQEHLPSVSTLPALVEALEPLVSAASAGEPIKLGNVERDLCARILEALGEIGVEPVIDGVLDSIAKLRAAELSSSGGVGLSNAETIVRAFKAEGCFEFCGALAGPGVDPPAGTEWLCTLPPGHTCEHFAVGVQKGGSEAWAMWTDDQCAHAVESDA